MSALPISPPTSARAGSASKSASPPPGAAGDFAALLDQTSARTASAEGPKNRPAQTEPRRRDAATPKDDNKGIVAPEAQVEAVTSPAQGVAEPTQGQTPSSAVTDAPQSQTPSGADTEPLRGLTPAVAEPTQNLAAASALPALAQAQPVADSSRGLTPAVAELSQGLASSGVAPSGGQVATATAAVLATPTPAVVDGATPQVADGSAPAGDGKLQIPAELLDAKAGAKGGQTKDFKNGEQPQRDLPPAPTLPPTADAAAAPAPAPAAAPTPPVDPGVAPAPAPTVAAQAQPAATPQTAVPVANGAPQLTRASVLQTAERVQELVRIATTRAGNARAILQLRPAELGQVDVHLRTTRNGLVATISAHEQVGLDAMQQAGHELRRTLEDKGVQLHSLDLQLGAGGHDFSNRGDAREASSGRRGAASSHGLGSDEPVAEDELTITHAPSTPAGALVDVQA
jgi:flagellar hook-length control protein FliK